MSMDTLSKLLVCHMEGFLFADWTCSHSLYLGDVLDRWLDVHSGLSQS